MSPTPSIVDSIQLARPDPEPQRDDANSSLVTLAAVERKKSPLNDDREQQRPSADGHVALESGHLPPTLTEPHLPSNLRRYSLLVIVCCAQFFDIFSASAVIVAVPKMAASLGMSSAEGSWIVNAYTLALASLFLASGRVADMYSAKWTFVVGFAWVGCFSLGVGLANDKTTVIVLRALTGVGAAATIPAALNLICHIFPEEREQAIAIACFSSCGAIANVAGLLLGAVLLLAGYSWIFFLVTIVALPVSAVAAFLIPGHVGSLGSVAIEAEKASTDAVDRLSSVDRKPKMDYVGLVLLTAAIVLLIFGVSEGNTGGWPRAVTLAPLVIGVLLLPLFFWWETRMDPIDALIDPAIWRLPNFTLLVVIGLAPNLFWFTEQVVFSEVMQNEWGLSAISTAVRFLPLSGVGVVVAMSVGLLPNSFKLKWRMMLGGALVTITATMLAFASRPDLYYPLCIPGFALGSGAMSLVWVSSYVSLMRSVPAAYSGTAGGVFNTSNQLGSSVGLAIATTIQVAFPAAEQSTAADAAVVPSWTGYQNSLFFVLASVALIPILTLLFYREPPSPVAGEEGEKSAATSPVH